MTSLNKLSYKSIYKHQSYLVKQEIIQRCCSCVPECLCIRGGGGFLLDNKVSQDCLVSGENLRIRKLNCALAHERCGSAVSGGRAVVRCSLNSRGCR